MNKMIKVLTGSGMFIGGTIVGGFGCLAIIRRILKSPAFITKAKDAVMNQMEPELHAMTNRIFEALEKQYGVESAEQIGKIIANEFRITNTLLNRPRSIVVFESREEAEKIINQLLDLEDTYSFVTIEDYYDLCGLDDTYNISIKERSTKLENVRGARTKRVKDGYIIEFSKI